MRTWEERNETLTGKDFKRDDTEQGDESTMMNTRKKLAKCFKSQWWNEVWFWVWWKIKKEALSSTISLQMKMNLQLRTECGQIFW